MNRYLNQEQFEFRFLQVRGVLSQVRTGCREAYMGRKQELVGHSLLPHDRAMRSARSRAVGNDAFRFPCLGNSTVTTALRRMITANG